MKVVHINSSSIGGAAKAAISLHESLLEEGVNSVFLYMNGPEINVRQAFQIKAAFSIVEKFLFKAGLRKHYWEKVAVASVFKKNKTIPFTISYTDFDILKSEQADHILNADIIHLHWITNCIDYSTFFNAITKPVFWTLHDMNPFTGGCHYDNHCTNYQSTCSNCPQLNHPESAWFAQHDLALKSKLKSNKNIHIISLNKWMKDKAAASSLFQKYVHHIVWNSIDTTIFTETQKDKATNILPAANTKKKIGYVATYHSELKGSDIFLQLVENYKTSTNIHFVYIGQQYASPMENCTYAGSLKTAEELAAFYRSLDLLIVPSRADNLPNVIIEAICCGTPVYASNVGGIPSLIHERNGCLIDSYNISDWVNALDDFHLQIATFNKSLISSEAAMLYNKKLQAENILKLYTDTLI